MRKYYVVPHGVDPVSPPAELVVRAQHLGADLCITSPFDMKNPPYVVVDSQTDEEAVVIPDHEGQATPAQVAEAVARHRQAELLAARPGLRRLLDDFPSKIEAVRTAAAGTAAGAAFEPLLDIIKGVLDELGSP